MKYNINLLSSLPKRVTVKLPSSFIIRVLAGYLGILFIIWGGTVAADIYQNTQLSTVSHSVDLAAKRWAASESSHIIAEGMDAKAKLLATLLEKKAKNGSIYLRDLALQVPAGVWLDNIEIGNGGESIKLSGKTFNSPLAMTMLQNLNAAPAFKGKKFKVFTLTVVPPAKTDSTSNQKLASFVVSTE